MRFSDFRKNRNLFLFLAAIASAPLHTGCGTAPIEVETPEQRVREERAWEGQLVAEIESRMAIKKADIEVSVFLKKMGESLAQVSDGLEGKPLGVFLLESAKKGDWRNFGTPGVRIYLASSLLKNLNFENEWSAVLAIELSHVASGHAIKHYKELLGKNSEHIEGSESQTLPLPALAPLAKSLRLKNRDIFGDAGVFSFTDEEWLASIDLTVGMMYRAGYDTRGLISVLLKYSENPALSPVSPSTLEKLLARTREKIAAYTPLLNPIVRSEKFIKIHKRMSKS